MDQANICLKCVDNTRMMSSFCKKDVISTSNVRVICDNKSISLMPKHVFNVSAPYITPFASFFRIKPFALKVPVDILNANEMSGTYNLTQWSSCSTTSMSSSDSSAKESSSSSLIKIHL
eukprot:853273_1